MLRNPTYNALNNQQQYQSINKQFDLFSLMQQQNQLAANFLNFNGPNNNTNSNNPMQIWLNYLKSLNYLNNTFTMPNKPVAVQSELFN